MLGGFIQGFVVCWVISGVIVIRVSLAGDRWRAVEVDLFADIVTTLLAVLVWPWLLGEDDDDA